MSATLKLNDEEYRNALASVLTGPNKALLVEAIFNICKDDWARGKILQAIVGIKPMPKYKVGDRLYIQESSANLYSCNTEKMIQEGMIVDKRVECTIIDNNPWKYYPYRIRIEVYKDGKDIIENHETDIWDESYLSPMEIFPEQPFLSQEDELPF